MKILAIPMTFIDLVRRSASKLKSNYRKTRIWKIDEKKLGYISIPKCASSSIRNHLTQYQQQNAQITKGLDQSGLKFCARISLFPHQVNQLREDYYLFSFVRNPLTRLYSCYRDKVVNAEKKKDRCSLSPYGIHFGMSFDAFVTRVVEIPDKYADQHFRSACSFLMYKGELVVDFVGKFERFNEDWEVIASQFGLPAPGKTKRVSGPSTGLKDIPISPSVLEMVIERYANDLDAFGYRDDLEALLP
jgi:hypothetical protein